MMIEHSSATFRIGLWQALRQQQKLSRRAHRLLAIRERHLDVCLVGSPDHFIESGRIEPCRAEMMDLRADQLLCIGEASFSERSGWRKAVDAPVGPQGRDGADEGSPVRIDSDAAAVHIRRDHSTFAP